MHGGADSCGIAPPFDPFPPGALWRVHEARFAPTVPNPYSRARLALPGHYAMLYAAETLPGALWEVLLRATKIKSGREVQFSAAKLQGMMATQVAPPSDRDVLELGMPGVLRLVRDGDGDLMAHLKHALATPRHRSTYWTARLLADHLKGVGVTQMPALAWHSRQFPKSKVYLDYHVLGAPDRWAVAGTSMPLDTPAGHALIRGVLAESGFEWVDQT